MKNLIRFFIFFAVFWVMVIGKTIELQAQVFQCAPALTNITIPNSTANLNLSENSIAVHPLNPNIVLNANNIHFPSGISAHLSTDWGVTWNPQTYNNLPNSGFDPTAMIDLNGYLYISNIGSGGVRVARSENTGRNWSNILIPNSSGADKPHSKIDNSCTSPFKGRIYCAWDYTGILFSYSSNSGASWVNPVTLPNSSPGHGVHITTDNTGNVYVIWPVQSRAGEPWNTLKLTKSTNGGVNWSAPVLVNLQYTVQKSASGWVSMAADMQNNTLYMVYSGQLVLQGNYDVYLKKSFDGGSTWSAESVVNQIQTNDQIFPWISCDPVTGYLACIYYDTRANPFEKHAYVSISTNSGNTWCDMRVSTVPVGAATGVGSDYIGIEFYKGIVYPVWTKSDVNFTYRTIIYPFEVIPKDLNIQNTVYYGSNVMQSARSITSSNITVSIGAGLIFRSGESITLNPGFAMGKTSTFIAELYNCEGYDNTQKFASNIFFELNKKDYTLPLEYSLSQNYPNPFNPVTSIGYTVKYSGWVSVKIYNILGQVVKSLVDNLEDAGHKSVIWDGTNNYGKPVSSGIYFYKMETRDFSDQKKMVIIR